MVFLNQINRRSFLVSFLFTVTCQCASAENREYQIKAAFLLNFVQFVQWPSSAFSAHDSPLCIGVLGQNPFGSALEDTVHGESIQDHKLTVQQSYRLEDLANCQLIFVSISEKHRIENILHAVGSRSVLTVSDIAGFAKQGGTINFYREQNMVRFEINPAAALKNGLKISSQLLRLGKIVDSAPEKEVK